MWSEFFQLSLVAVGVAALATLVAMLSRRQRYVEYQIKDLGSLKHDQFARDLAGVVQVDLLDGNRIELLQDGEEAFPSMFQAVRDAQRSITFENYIYWSDAIGNEFAELLAEKARQQVGVHVVVDWLGSKTMDRRAFRRMEQAGVEVHYYHRPRLGAMHRLNRRTHRRELIIDGRVGFTGGICFASEWTSDERGGESRRDNHYRIEGPLVADLQAVFMDNWLKTSGHVLHGERYFPDLADAGDTTAGVVGSSPHERTSWARLLVLMLLTGARSSIRLEQAYFVPDAATSTALVEAARRGVDVGLVLPNEKIDYRLVRRASRCYWGPLLEAGVKIYEYQPSMLHAKLIMVDDLWVLVGSLNFDRRSFYRNDEVALLVRDARFARRHVEVFEQDKRNSLQINLDQWQARSRFDKLLDGAASLLSSQI